MFYLVLIKLFIIIGAVFSEAIGHILNYTTMCSMFAVFFFPPIKVYV